MKRPGTSFVLSFLRTLGLGKRTPSPVTATATFHNLNHVIIHIPHPVIGIH